MRFFRRKQRGFTLIELLTVVVIIIILAGLILSVAGFVQKKGAMSRAQSEIAAMSAALESYKADNGVYPDDGTYSGTYSAGNAAKLYPTTMGDPTQSTYKLAGLVLYRALSGDRDLNSTVNTSDEQWDVGGNSLGANALTSLPTVYYPFTPSQLITSGSTVLGIADPFGYSYGYSTAYNTTGTNGYNPTYDLWSTCGNVVKTTPASTDTAKWITNW